VIFRVTRFGPHAVSGFVRGDLRFGEDLIGGSGKAGIRYQW
jgi:hypothetical protein